MTPPDTSTTTSAPSTERQVDVPPSVTARLRARRRRVARIRKRTLAIAGSAFALLWGVIFVQLVSGHDPALAHNSRGASSSTTSSSGSSSSNSALNRLRFDQLRQLGLELLRFNELRQLWLGLLRLWQHERDHHESVVMPVESYQQAPVAPAREVVERFPCFGGACAVLVEGDGLAWTAARAATHARRRLERWHHQFSRFEAQSELSRLNSDPRRTVPVTRLMARFVEAALSAAAMTGGLVDPTLVTEIERAGYAETLDLEQLSPGDFMGLRRRRCPGAPRPDAPWREVTVDRGAGTVTRPAGLRLDSGGIAKGLFGDVLAVALGTHRSFAVAAAGDLRFGGTARRPRPIQVASPFDESILHTFELLSGAAATSGISKRSWIDRDGDAAHHMLDPATGRPAFTGVMQVTALAPTGVEAEALSKASLLSGADRATAWLPHGGLVVYDDSSIDVVAADSTEVET